jgi:hypothetical protein
VLLDNMTPEAMREAVAMVDGPAITEASGRINLATAPAVAATGVDLISCGADPRFGAGYRGLKRADTRAYRDSQAMVYDRFGR